MREDKKGLNWDQVFIKWEESDLSVNEFCRRNKIKPSRFYYWKKRLAYKCQITADKKILSQNFISIQKNPKSDSNITFIILGHEISFSQLPEAARIAELTKALSHESFTA